MRIIYSLSIDWNLIIKSFWVGVISIEINHRYAAWYGCMFDINIRQDAQG
jgi:hypothetical protein